MLYRICVLILCFESLRVNALNCRTEGSLKSDQLKRIYNNCMKQYDHNSSSSRNSSGNDWRDRSNQNNNRDRSDNERNNGQEARNWMDGRIDSNRNDYDNDNDNEQNYRDQDSMNSNGRNQNGNSYGHSDRQNDRMNNRNMDWGGNSYQQNDRSNRRDYYQNSDYGSQESQMRNMYSYPNNRYKRERSEKNSGQRSQYNPNMQRSDNNRDNRTSNENSKENGKACAMYCFLDNLHMTGENGMPDRYLVTNAITKDVRNEDLRDFLQESIEECFQILDNENTDDKCEFSKNLLVCLSEKGRASCDDWKDDIQFT